MAENITEKSTSAAPEKKADKKPVPAYATQDQTSRYEEYLFGRGTYAEGATQKSLSDSTQGRIFIRLISRGVFGAAGFVLGGHYANKSLWGYNAQNVKCNFGTLKSNPLQFLAKAIDVGVGEPIKAAVKMFAKGSEAQRQVIANRAVRFRQKSYYHALPGQEAGRTFGSEIVSVTFDFACASTADATARSLIQLGDPSMQKPWRDKEGRLDIDAGVKSFASAAWRIFSKNQGEDWAAAFPYVFQMKLQRNMIAKWAPGFKLASDMQINGASTVIDKTGKIIGDYQKWGALDLQLRFMGYNWYTLMYREAYDSVANGWQKWKDNHFSLALPEHFNPVTASAEGAAHAVRYVTKSLIKSALYMAPSVPFFWVFRTPQSKWRAPLIYDPSKLGDHDNAYVTRAGHDKIIEPEYSAMYGTKEFRQSTYESGARVWQGGTHTNGNRGMVDMAHFGTAAERVQARPITPMGRGEIYTWKNQKTLWAKALNPFGWLSYHTGSVAVKTADKIAHHFPRMDALTAGDAPMRERLTRGFVDASYSYTPYMIAKAEFALRVDDRQETGQLGEMDKAIYGAMDHFVTFDLSGFSESCKRIGHLLFSSDLAIGKATQAKPATTPQSLVQASSITIPSLQTNTQSILTRPSFAASADTTSHADKLASQRQGKMETFLYPESRTLQ